MVAARIYVVRHGETQANRDGVVQGQLDTELNAAGLEQARRVARALRAVHFDAAYSSDLLRALKTAQIILEHRPDIEICTDKALRERYMGELQGKKLLLPPGTGVWAIATGEAPEALAARAAGWWTRAVLQRTLALPPRDTAYNVLVTSHGGLIGGLVRTLIGSGRVRCAEGVVVRSCGNTGVTVVEVDAQGVGTVVRYGDVTHLSDEEAEGMVETNVDEAVVGPAATRIP
ncbi:phosphoglycerate mutase-like protein [Mycena belliarum]|uniref:Phosphoglycerate mutase-like protein n=1 Tax=Mycena belliarum TaxID=1033014 RepID=A0AAD6TWX6_9AGAR|nr:phosphoglycerate mutase-like protein [Mycena belliae]